MNGRSPSKRVASGLGRDATRNIESMSGRSVNSIAKRGRRALASIPLDKAATSGTLELAAELIGLGPREWPKLRRVEHAALALVLLANEELMAGQH
jgi:hypothetical protein